MAKLTIRTTAMVTIYLHDEPEVIATKQVLDSDGFWTDYTWYRMPDGTHRFIFGDIDIYGPEDEADWECDSYLEASEWFSTYNGFEDEDSEEDEDEEYEGIFGDLEDILEWMNLR